ncbi:MAG: PAS domain-containing protein [Phycisphaerales bacterium]
MTVRKRLQLLGLSGIVVMFAVVSIVFVDAHYRAIEREKAIESAESRSEFLEQVTQALGYGGIVHNLKNYILRADQRYRDEFQQGFAELLTLIDQQLAWPEILPEEVEAIEAIRRVAVKYDAALTAAIRVRHEQLRSEEDLGDIRLIDDAARVNDAEALAAIKKLAEIRYIIELENSEAIGARMGRTVINALLVTCCGTLIFGALYRSLTKSIMQPVVRLGIKEELDAVLAAAILSESPRPVVLLDNELSVLFVSNLWREQFGADMAIPGQVFDVSREGMPPEWNGALVKALGGEKVEVTRAQLNLTGLDPVWVRLEARSWVDPTTGLRGVIAVLESVDSFVEMEEQLRAATEQVELAVEGTNDGIWDWPNIKLLDQWWSPNYFRLIGYDPEEVPASIDSLLDLMHMDHREAFIHAIEQAKQGVAHLDEEFMLRCKDGEYRWFRTRARIFDVDLGKPTRMAGSIQDVHERVLAENRLAAAENELRMILDSVPAYIYYKDDNNKIIKVNRTAADAMGMSVEEIEGRQTEELFPAAHASAFLEDDRKVLSSGKPLLGIEEAHEGGRGEHRLIRTDKFPLRSAPDAPFDHLVAVATDVTDIRRAELKFREVSERLQLALKSANQAAWDQDLLTKEVVFSDSWFTMLGYIPNELPMTNATWQNLIHPEDHSLVKPALDAHVTCETDIYDIQYRMRCKDGSWKWIRSVGRCSEPDSSGHPQRLVGMNIDIHELKRLQVELESKNTEMERFVYTASHDLKSPIVTILGYLRHLLDDVKRDQFDEIEDFGERIQRAAEHMRENIDSLLEISRLAKNNLPVESVALEQMIRGTLGQFQLELDEAGFEVELDLGDHFVLAAPTHVSQVIENLVSNAIRYGAESDNPQLRVSTSVNDKGMIELSVQDSGGGVDPEHRDRVFGLFEKLTNTKGSSGVGLAIVRRVTDLYAGRVWVSESPLGGADFRVILPRAPDLAPVSHDEERLYS